MLLTLSHSLELEWIRFLHRFKAPLLDEFFKYMDFFDRSEYFFILIPLVFVGYHWKMGLRLFYTLFFSALINQGLKDVFSLPRPFHLDASVGMIQVNGYGLPSGAAQTSIVLAAFLLKYWKSPYKWLIAPLYILVISFSRIYLGVHFPSDILAGWVAGLVCIILQPFIEKHLKRFSTRILLLLSQLIPLALLGLHRSVITIQLCSIAIGIGIGLFIAHFYKLFPPPSRNGKEFAIRAAVGVFSVFLLQVIIKMLPSSSSQLYPFFIFFFLGIWLSAGSGWLWQSPLLKLKSYK